MRLKDSPRTLPSVRAMRRAFAAKDAGYDGVFFVAVKTTGIFCRPSCPSRPKPEHVEFFGTIGESVGAGYRPCKRCRPLEAGGAAPAWVGDLMARVESMEEPRMRAADLRALGITPERARRWFRRHYGVTFAAWCRSHRLARAFTEIRNGTSLDDATFGSGFASHSGFRSAFQRVFGAAPGRTGGARRIVLTFLESPLGPLLAGASEEGICLLEYPDRRMLERNLMTLRERFGCPAVPGSHPLLTQLRRELEAYFAGRRRAFDVPIAARGTPFQEMVWRELARIPHGTTISYAELARRVGRPSARRAVARANGQNRISILIPCHRVIGQDGSLTGYGGGLWRKRLLLHLESGAAH